MAYKTLCGLCPKTTELSFKFVNNFFCITNQGNQSNFSWYLINCKKKTMRWRSVSLLWKIWCRRREKKESKCPRWKYWYSGKFFTCRSVFSHCKWQYKTNINSYPGVLFWFKCPHLIASDFWLKSDAKLNQNFKF